MCVASCPTGYKESSGSCVLVHSESDFVFHLNPVKIEDIVYDLRNSVPVLTGEDNQFYPEYGEFDPYAAKDRGYYFTGVSYMQLPPHSSSSSPLLVLSPSFTVSAWVRPIKGSGSIICKKDSGQTRFCLGIDNYFPELDLKLTSGSSKAVGSVLDDSGWNFLTAKTYVSSSQYFIEIWNNSTLTSVVESGWFSDSSYSFSFKVGTNYLGFIWDIKIYNSFASNLVRTECADCTHCPLELNQTCLPNCGIESYWDGFECVECEKNCQLQGCVRKDMTCNLCQDQQCYRCSDYEANCSECINRASNVTSCECNNPFYWSWNSEACICPSGTYLLGNNCLECKKLCKTCLSEYFCTKCVEHASLTSDSECKCDPGYLWTGSVCEKQYFYATLEVRESNYLNLTFTSRLNRNLTTDDYKITLETQSIEFSYSMGRESNFSYSISLDSKDFIEKGENLTLKFISELRDVDNKFLFNKSLSGTLYEYDPEKEPTQKGTRIGENLVLGVSVISLALSIVSMNGSCFMSILSTLQILAYIPISNNPLTPFLVAFYKTFRVFKYLPNLFGVILSEETSPSKHRKASDYGYVSSLFLLNSGGPITGLLTLLVVCVILWGLSKLIVKLKVPLKRYRYGLMLRFGLLSYLPLGVTSLVQFYTSFGNAGTVVSFASAILVCVFLVGFLVLTCRFTRKNTNEIQRLSDESWFYNKWGALYEEFKPNQDSAKYFYTLYMLKRLLYSLNLILMQTYPVWQALTNIGLVFSFFGYVVFCSPYAMPLLEVSNSLGEFGIFGIFCLVTYFLNEEKDSIQLVENIVFYLTLAVLAVHIIASFCLFVKAVSEVLKKTYGQLSQETTRNRNPVEELSEADPRWYFRRKK